MAMHLPAPEPGQRSIIVVDGDQAVRESFSVLLRLNGYSVATFANGRALLDIPHAARPDCLLIEVDLPDIDGRFVVTRWRAAGHRTPVVMMAAHQRRLELGEPIALLRKPIEEASLLTALSSAIEREGRGRSW